MKIWLKMARNLNILSKTLTKLAEIRSKKTKIWLKLTENGKILMCPKVCLEMTEITKI